MEKYATSFLNLNLQLDVHVLSIGVGKLRLSSAYFSKYSFTKTQLAHLFTYCLWLLSHEGRIESFSTETVRPINLNTIWTLRKSSDPCFSRLTSARNYLEPRTMHGFK